MRYGPPSRLQQLKPVSKSGLMPELKLRPPDPKLPSTEPDLRSVPGGHKARRQSQIQNSY